jgi:hypothetical protein
MADRTPESLFQERDGFEGSDYLAISWLPAQQITGKLASVLPLAAPPMEEGSSNPRWTDAVPSPSQEGTSNGSVP